MPRLTPLEIQRSRFPRRLFGYAPEAVQEMLALIAEQVEEDVEMRGELKSQLAKACREIEEYRQREHQLRAELTTLQQAAEEVVERAETERARTLTEAQALAQRVVEEAGRRAESIEVLTSQMKTQRRMARADLKRLAEVLTGIVRDDEAAEHREGEASTVALLHRREAKA